MSFQADVFQADVFQADVEATPRLEGAHREGVQALENKDRGRLDIADPRALAGSVNLDIALKEAFPNANRWDYVIAERKGRRGQYVLHWIEVHPASGGGVKDAVIKKLDWLKEWLAGDGRRLKNAAIYEPRFVWIASGRCPPAKNAPDARSLAKRGIIFVGRRYSISA